MDICIMPRWAGTSSDDWYPWLRGELTGHTIHVASLRPSPGAPSIAACVRELHALYAELDLSRTLLIGHSVGCQAHLHALASLPADAVAPALLCVAGWWWVDEPWETLRPWMDAPAGDQVRRHVAQVSVLLSDNDPFTSDHEANRVAWQDRLGAEVSIIAGAKHFNGAQERAVLDAVRTSLA
jgi:hypothetical protein